MTRIKRFFILSYLKFQIEKKKIQTSVSFYGIIAPAGQDVLNMLFSIMTELLSLVRCRTAVMELGSSLLELQN